MADIASLTREQRIAEMQAIRWFHRIDLGDGLITPGVDDSPRKLAEIRMPTDLSGKSVFDIGAYDGFFSFAAERRGAARVVAMDNWGEPECSSKTGFEFARRALGSRVEDVKGDVQALNPARLGTFDLVLFMGVLYHLRHPLLGLEKVASVTREMVILETHADLLDLHRPAMAFYPGRELAGDPTNWWGPNTAAVEAMLRTVGFTRVEIVHATPREFWPHRVMRAVYNSVSKGYRLGDTQRWGRLVFHAWK
jgi:tRNA (mo5U34)-methyltransferase